MQKDNIAKNARLVEKDMMQKDLVIQPVLYQAMKIQKIALVAIGMTLYILIKKFLKILKNDKCIICSKQSYLNYNKKER